MSNYQERLKRLEDKQRKLLAEIQDAKARAKQQERRDDARRKILVGAMLLAESGDSWESLKPKLDDYLSRPNDRRLFGLPVDE